MVMETAFVFSWSLIKPPPLSQLNLENTFRIKISRCAATLFSPMTRELGCPHALRSWRQLFLSSSFTFFPMMLKGGVAIMSRKSPSFILARSSGVWAAFHLGSLRCASALKDARCLVITWLYSRPTAPTQDRTTQALCREFSKQAMASARNRPILGSAILEAAVRKSPAVATSRALFSRELRLGP